MTAPWRSSSQSGLYKISEMIAQTIIAATIAIWTRSNAV